MTVRRKTFQMSRGAIAVVAGCALFLSACGDDANSGSGNSGVSPTPSPTSSPTPAPTPTPADPAQCSLQDRQSWVLAQLRAWYLFPDLLNVNANPAHYVTIQDYIDALVGPARAQNRDRYFTYLTSITEENAYYEQGVSAGFGFRLGYDVGSRRLFVTEAFENGPALGHNIDRGSEILAIGATSASMQTVNALIATDGPAGLMEAMGPDQPGVARAMRVRDVSGVVREVFVTKTSYVIDPVSSRYGAKIIVDGDQRIGYINLRTFIGTADPALKSAFANFKSQGVTRLIVDLRYNGGGLLSVATLLGDLMAGDRDGDVFGYTVSNVSGAEVKTPFSIHARPQSITASRIAFIGTGSTASASELVINGFAPFLGANMALIGSNTYGKPVAQSAFDRPLCDDRLRAVTAKIENSAGDAEYYDGLAKVVPVTCRAFDDISRPLGDPEEAMVRAALDYLGSRGGCTPIGDIMTASTPENEALVPKTPSSTIERELPGVF